MAALMTNKMAFTRSSEKRGTTNILEVLLFRVTWRKRLEKTCLIPCP
jgi:hypothetical protein